MHLYIVAGESVFWWEHYAKAAKFSDTRWPGASWDWRVAELHLYMFVNCIILWTLCIHWVTLSFR